MSEEKGILSKKAEKELGNIADDLVKAGFLEVIDGTAFTFVIGFIDNKWGDKMPEPYKTDLRTVLDTVIIDKDYEVAIDEVMNRLDILIDIPFLDDESEKEIFAGFARMLKGLLMTVKK